MYEYEGHSTGTHSAVVPCLLLSTPNHGSLGIVRSLGRIGVPVYVACSNLWQPIARSKYCSGVFKWDFPCESVQQAIASLRIIGRSIGIKSVLFAGFDQAAVLISEHRDELREFFLLPEPPPKLIRRLCSKKQMEELATSCRVATPKCVYPNNIDELMQYAETAKFPLVLKGIDGPRLQLRIARKMVTVNSVIELRTICRRIGESEIQNVLLQEYIPGDDETVWMFDGYFDQHGDCLAAATGRKLRQNPPYMGVTSLGLASDNSELKEIAVGFMKQVHYRGAVDMDFRYDSRDKKYKLLDVNPRLGATFRLFADEKGNDLARAMYMNLTFRPVPNLEPTNGRKWIVEFADLQCSLTYRRDNHLTLRKWLASFKGVKEAGYFAIDDVRPFLAKFADAVKVSLQRWFPQPRYGTDY